MPATVIVGLQWGDEGKGKTTDFLAEQVALAVRYQGGDNAGHTVVLGNEVFKLHLVPSGVLYPHISCVIGPGVVVNPATLIAELDMLAERGIDISQGPGQPECPPDPAVPHRPGCGDGGAPRRRGGRDDPSGDRSGLRRPGPADRPAGRGPRRRGLVPGPPRPGSCPTRTPARPPAGREPSSSSSHWSARRWPGASACGRTWPIRSGSSRTPSPGAITSCSKVPRARSSTSTTAATRT